MRLIDADALIKKWENVHSKDMSFEMAIIGAINDVKNAPTIDAVPVRHGKWIRKTDTRFGEMLNDLLICSECQIAFSTLTMIRRSYCPNCGARMDEERKVE